MVVFETVQGPFNIPVLDGRHVVMVTASNRVGESASLATPYMPELICT